MELLFLLKKKAGRPNHLSFVQTASILLSVETSESHGQVLYELNCRRKPLLDLCGDGDVEAGVRER